jgi:hypothetical protein
LKKRELHIIFQIEILVATDTMSDHYAMMAHIQRLLAMQAASQASNAALTPDHRPSSSSASARSGVASTSNHRSSGYESNAAFVSDHRPLSDYEAGRMDQAQSKNDTDNIDFTQDNDKMVGKKSGKALLREEGKLHIQSANIILT